MKNISSRLSRKELKSSTKPLDIPLYLKPFSVPHSIPRKKFQPRLRDFGKHFLGSLKARTSSQLST